MKRIAFGLFFVLAMFAARAADTNFAGTWELDLAKSEGLQGRFGKAPQTWTVTQDAKTLTVEAKVTVEGREPFSIKSAYNLDGTETTADVSRGQMTGKSTTKATWGEGNKTLETSTEFVGKRGETEVKNMTKDKWELADEGKTLKIDRTREGGQGAGASKLVFTKK